MADITNNTELVFSVGTSRKCVNWRNTKTNWMTLKKFLSKPKRTSETTQEYFNMTRDERAEIKDVGGFVGGIVNGGRRVKGSVTQRSMLTLDIDECTCPDLWDDITFFWNVAMCMYSTHTHTPAHPRYRLIIPLSRIVDADEYEAIARYMAKEIGIEYFDDTTYQPERLMYWPSVSKDGEFVFESQDGPMLDADYILGTFDNYKDKSTLPHSSRVESIVPDHVQKPKTDPEELPGLLGAFCRTYSISEAIATFLPDVYVPCDSDPNRYTYTGGSTSGGLVVYDDKFAYSHHSTDPAMGIMCNAFDLVRIHKFGEFDAHVAKGTPLNEHPSQIAMRRLVESDQPTKLEMFRTNFDLDEEKTSALNEQIDEDKEHNATTYGTTPVTDFFGEDTDTEPQEPFKVVTPTPQPQPQPQPQPVVDKKPQPQPKKDLGVNRFGTVKIDLNAVSVGGGTGKTKPNVDVGAIKSLCKLDPKSRKSDTPRIANSIANYERILTNDPTFGEPKLCYDTFSKQPVWKEEPYWRKFITPYDKFLCQFDIDTMASLIEETYEIQSTEKLNSAITNVSHANIMHPVQDYLNSLRGTWDGVMRCETMFKDFLGVEDDAYTREVTRCFMTAMIKRIYFPGCKFDNMVVLKGPQGVGKSTFVQKLLPTEQWFVDTMPDLKSKDALQHIQGKWLIEIAELASMRKSESEEIKAFLSTQVDKFRAPYARVTEANPRTCIFFATTNEQHFLKDASGDRRFWVLEAHGDAEMSLWDDLTDEYRNQLWAEALEYYEANPNHTHLSRECEEMRKENNAQYRSLNADPRVGIISAYLDTKLPVEWRKMDINQRVIFLADDDRIDEEGVHEHNETCAIEVACEALKMDYRTALNDAQIIKHINEILSNLPNWKRAKKRKIFKHYGTQEMFVRIGSVADYNLHPELEEVKVVEKPETAKDVLKTKLNTEALPPLGDDFDELDYV